MDGLIEFSEPVLLGVLMDRPMTPEKCLSLALFELLALPDGDLRSTLPAFPSISFKHFPRHCYNFEFQEEITNTCLHLA
jgi:hypothetical protein